jgi:stalled ribosome rescue protein Dom34
MRRITKESESGGVTSMRVPIDLVIEVSSTDFDVGSGQLHVAGKVATENEHVKMGSFHTLDLELQRKFTLTKADGWDSVAVEMLREAVDTTKRAQVWAVVMQEGLANVCLITEHQTILQQKVEVAIPRKRKGGLDGHDKVRAKAHWESLNWSDNTRVSTGSSILSLALFFATSTYRLRHRHTSLFSSPRPVFSLKPSTHTSRIPQPPQPTSRFSPFFLRFSSHTLLPDTNTH